MAGAAPVRQATLVLFAAVGLLLLLTCANVANLQLARTVARQREMATHAALGATAVASSGSSCSKVSRWRSPAVSPARRSPAGASRQSMPSLIPEIPQLQHMAVDATVLAFAVAVSVATGLVFGLVPAWGRRGTHCRTVSRRAARAPAVRGRSVRGSLVSLQIGLTVTVVVIGALLVRSFVELQRVPLGFRSENVLTFQVNLPASAYGTPERRVAFYETWFTRLQAIPGVLDVGASTRPTAPSEWKVDVAVPGAAAAGQADARPAAVARAVTASYFQALGVPLTRGRVFATWTAAPEKLELVVSESFARRFWPAGKIPSASPSPRRQQPVRRRHRRRRRCTDQRR